MGINLSAWPGLLLGERLDSGHRNSCWLGDLAGERVVVRRIRRPLTSLEWELDLIAHLGESGILVPTAVRTDEGALHAGGIAVQRWLDGREPTTRSDWQAVADELKLVHEASTNFPQRPEACTVLELRAQRRSLDADIDLLPIGAQERILAVFDQFKDVNLSVVHGDPNASNIRIQDDGRVGFLDWDESRVDVVWHDLSNLGVQVLSDENHLQAQALSHAWEAVNGWILEPDYAHGRLRQLEEM